MIALELATVGPLGGAAALRLIARWGTVIQMPAMVAIEPTGHIVGPTLTVT